MTWKTMPGTLDGVQFELDPDHDVPVVLVDRRSWTKGDMTGRVLLVRLPSWLFSLYERLTGWWLDRRLFAGLSADERAGRLL